MPSDENIIIRFDVQFVKNIVNKQDTYIYMSAKEKYPC